MMKQDNRLLTVVAITLLACIIPSIANAHIDLEGFAQQVRTPVVVDGDLDEWEATQPIDSLSQAKAQWDAMFLYLAFHVTDEELLESPNAHEIYLGDCVEISVDLANDSQFEYAEGDYQFAFSVPSESGDVEVALYRRGGEGVDVETCIVAAGRRTADGYDLEIQLDMAALGSVVPENGVAIGFEFVVTNYRTALPVERYRWSGREYSMREPIRWGDLIFTNDDPTDSTVFVKQLDKHRKQANAAFHGKYDDPTPPQPLPAETEHSLRQLRERLTEQLNKRLPEEKIRGYLDTIQDDGSWAELDRSYKDGHVVIDIYRHLYWVFDLAVAYHFEDTWGYHDPEVLDALNRSLDYWLEQDFQFNNWWNNEIGTPLYIARIGLLMGDELSPEQLSKMIPILRRAYNTMTGQNLLWINQVILLRGILQENPALVQRAIDAIAGEIIITTEEGIQPDFSFHQHGSQLYSHGYGAGFLLDSLRILTCTSGGQFELPEDKRSIIERYLLDGSRWMARGTFADYGAHGRGITRRGANAGYLGRAAEYMLSFPTDRADELKQLAASARGEAPDELEGNRHFYRSDFMVHRRKPFYASIKMYSERTIGTESFNGEGLKSYYLPDGCLFLLRRGDEYKEIQPLWDWRKIPGVTCPQSDEPVPSVNYRETKTSGNTTFVGGVSDGWYGAAVYDYERDGVSLKKACFGFDWGLVCLGAGLTSSREEPIATTVNQCWLRSDVLYGGSSCAEAESVHLDEPVKGDLEWVFHDDVLYQLIEPGSVLLEAGERSGRWWDVNHGESKDLVKGNVFALTLQHGIQPEKASYAYAIYPEVKESAITSRLKHSPFTILANNTGLQAVADATAAVAECLFYQPGSVDLPWGITLSVDEPCALLVRGTQITVANPEGEALDVTVSLQEKGCATSVEQVFSLPGGKELGGSSVTRGGSRRGRDQPVAQGGSRRGRDQPVAQGGSR